MINYRRASALWPPVSRFGGGNQRQKKLTVIEKLKAFFERFFGIGGAQRSGLVGRKRSQRGRTEATEKEREVAGIA